MKNRKSKRSDGFTLLEVLFAAILIGVAIAALVGTSGAFTMKNAAGLDLSTAEFLIEEVRERTVQMPFSALESFNPSPNPPPKDLNGEPLNDFAAFAQQVSVTKLNDDLSSPATQATINFVKVTVTNLKNGHPISTASWIRAKLD